MKKTTVILSAKYQSHGDELDAWRDEVWANGDLIEAECAKAGFTKSMMEFSRDFNTGKQVTLIETEIFGNPAFVAIVIERSNDVRTKIDIQTPCEYYRAQGVAWYSSSADPRVKAIDEKFYQVLDDLKNFTDVEDAWGRAKTEITTEKNALLASIYDEQVALFD